jgi:hypothetical protein
VQRLCLPEWTTLAVVKKSGTAQGANRALRLFIEAQGVSCSVGPEARITVEVILMVHALAGRGLVGCVVVA